jgi:hypothetical protein
MMRNYFLYSYLVLGMIYGGVQGAESMQARQKLWSCYIEHCEQTSDIHEHVPVLRQYASECSSVIEIGLRTMNSSWGILQGLSENSSLHRSYLGIDLEQPADFLLNQARDLAQKNGISFDFWQANDLFIDIKPTEMLFIDSLHIYCHLTYELEKFSPKVSKYIIMHDTSDPWGSIDDFQQYHGNRSEYPEFIDRHKRGLWQAVEDFLARHPEWVLHERRLNNHGLTVLKRISN